VGHDVMRINHIGDFGLQFGMMVWYIELNKLIDQIEQLNLQDLYVIANELAKTDKDFYAQSQIKTYELQNNIEPAISIHKKICQKSREHFEKNYKYLGIKGMIEMGESFYQNLIPPMVLELEQLGLLEQFNDNVESNNNKSSDNVESNDKDNRKVIKTNIRGKQSAITIVKSNCGYTYDTTDLCAIKYRTQVLKANQILYVVDSGQSEHFEQIFQVANKVGWVNNKTNEIINLNTCKLTHVNFGFVLGEDGKKISSRDGGTLKLLELFEETIKQTEIVIKNKNPLVRYTDIKKLAIGSIKYADLKTDRKLNYKFSYSKMLSFTGNTLCYIMYGYLRSKKVIEKYMSIIDKIETTLKINELNEKDLKVIKFILKYPEYIEKVLQTNEPNHLTTYLYELVELVHQLYKSNRVMEFDSDNKLTSTNNSRINIFIVSNKIIIEIFDILNIESIDFM
jgi:arginyl-tRNA synthetase